MAPITKAEEMDYFALMGLTPSATEAEIRKAHKKMSLALHPDKNRHVDPTLAAARFSEMQLAYEVLMDPSARLAAAERNKAQTARQERQGAYEGKRKAMAEELERREEEEREKRFKGARDGNRRKETLERLREEGKRLRGERERKQQQQQQQQHQAQKEAPEHDDTAMQAQSANQSSDDSKHSASPEPELGPLDLTVKLRFPTDVLTRLSTPSTAAYNHADSPLARGLAARFGAVDSVIFRAPKQGKREATAHATFKTLDAAYAAVKAGGALNAGGHGAAQVLEDVWIGWAAGARSSANGMGSQPGEPARIAWMRRHGKLMKRTTDSPANGHGHTSPSSEPDVLHRLRMENSDEQGSISVGEPSTSAFPTFSFHAGPQSEAKESDILQRMRQAERQRVEEAIRRADEGRSA